MTNQLLDFFRMVIEDYDARIATGHNPDYGSPLRVPGSVVEAMRAALEPRADANSVNTIGVVAPPEPTCKHLRVQGMSRVDGFSQTTCMDCGADLKGYLPPVVNEFIQSRSGEPSAPIGSLQNPLQDMQAALKENTVVFVDPRQSDPPVEQTDRLKKALDSAALTPKQWQRFMEAYFPAIAAVNRPAGTK